MVNCFGWILDARLHIAVIASLIVWLAQRIGPDPEPAPDSPFNSATFVIPDGSGDSAGEPMAMGAEWLSTAGGLAEGRWIAH